MHLPNELMIELVNYPGQLVSLWKDDILTIRWPPGRATIPVTNMTVGRGARICEDAGRTSTRTEVRAAFPK